MAVPLQLAGIGSTIAGGVLGAEGASSQAAAQSNMYAYQAGIARQNEDIDKSNASWALRQGEDEASQSGMATKFQEGKIITGQAASGFNVNTGTNVKVQQGQELIGKEEEINIRSSSAKRAYDYDVGALQEKEQAGAYDAASTNAKIAGQYNVAASILGTVGSVASKWSQYQQSVGNAAAAGAG